MKSIIEFVHEDGMEFTTLYIRFSGDFYKVGKAVDNVKEFFEGTPYSMQKCSDWIVSECGSVTMTNMMRVHNRDVKDVLRLYIEHWEG